MRLFSSLRARRRHAILAMIAAGLALPLAAPGVLAQCQTNQNCWPPPGGCAYPAPGPIFYPGTPGPHGIRNGFLHDPSACAPMPSQGGSSIDSFFDIFVEIDLTGNGGVSWTPYALPSRPSRVLIEPPFPQGGDLIFPTEMLQLDLSGGGIPVMIRESPTLASLGGILQRDLGGGQYHIDSFFDVFTELSLDGGQTWYPSDQALRITTIDQAPTPARTSTWGTVKIRYR